MTTPIPGVTPEIMIRAAMLCVMDVVRNDVYVETWLRLRGVSLPKSHIAALIDSATGYQDAVARMFIGDAIDLVWNRLPEDAVRDYVNRAYANEDEIDRKTDELQRALSNEEAKGG